ncbi:unnamed protein product [Mycena citricolor]|nr:unnamed protein product [Mycena citricolor]
MGLFSRRVNSTNNLTSRRAPVVRGCVIEGANCFDDMGIRMLQPIVDDREPGICLFILLESDRARNVGVRHQ